MLYEKYGEGISEKFLVPYNEKLYACDLNKLDMNAMGRFFPNATPEEIVRGFGKKQKKTYNDEFYYHVKGARVFVDTLFSKLKSERVWCNTEIWSINLSEKYVETNEGRIYYEYLLNTLPLNKFMELANIPKWPDMSSNQVLVYNMGFDKASIDSSVHWIYFPEKEYCFYRVGFYNNILGQEKLSIYVEIGRSAEEDCSNVDIETVLSDLKKAGIIDTHVLKSYCKINMNPAYVHISSNSIHEVKKLVADLETKHVYLLGRYGRWTYCSIEDCVLQAYDAVDSIIKNADEQNVIKEENN